ncbi:MULTISPECIES: EamA family transporter [unclassified Variovorax]|jgi:probable blue pigment (indigoidine) exporter|uniref:EamA family transporter n=1 Tax=unclassified Variovorax TaxID=663243 RepID=UPI000F7EE03E|nr:MULTISPECIES: EamA family transporter [unclassified Variovorax]RSZ38306.1 EamA family transporter [Variovorax sp. 553]RSZ39241.1 EamA family transporter [Variovorax sp. 679]
MTSRTTDILLTAAAPAIWGSTYIVTTELLPANYPLTVALLRALPAGLLLLAIVRQLPERAWWGRIFILGALNFSLLWAMLFLAAYRLPGGVAATITSVQPLLVVFLASVFLGSPVRALSVAAAVVGIGGVALLVLTPNAALDALGIAAAIAAAVSMAFGTVLSRRWQPPVSALTFTAWQLTAGGLLLLPVALLLEPPLPALTLHNWIGFGWLGLVGAALTYIVWFRGVARLEPSTIAPLAFLSPVMAVILGWALLGQSLSTWQVLGILIVIASIWLSQHAQRGGQPTARPAAAIAR